MTTKHDLKDFEEAIEAQMAEFAGKLTKDEMIGTFELLISSMQEAIDLEAAGG